jgi:hypothetical protein
MCAVFYNHLITIAIDIFVHLNPFICLYPAGLVVGPLLLYLDVHPLAASATSSLMVLLSVGSATITYAIQVGLLPWLALA